MNSKEYKKEIGKILYTMAEVFRDEVSELLIDGWVAVMASEKVTVDEARIAAVQVMKSREYNKLPAPAVFLDIIRPRTDPKQIAEAQADVVIAAVGRHSIYDIPIFGDQITAELMGTRWPWQKFASDLKSAEVKWWRKDFVEAYIGKHESEERLKLQAPKPKRLERIGNTGKDRRD